MQTTNIRHNLLIFNRSQIHILVLNVRFLFLFCIPVMLIGCDTEKTPEELFDEYRSGVVLILNQYYYQMKLPNNQYVYFANFDSNGNLPFYVNLNDIKDKKAMLFGSGFFVDTKGSIMTNRHVAQPLIDKSAVKDQLNNMLISIKEYYNQQLQQLQQQYADVENQKSGCVYNDYEGNSYCDYTTLAQLNDQETTLESKFDSIRQIRDGIMDGNISLEELDIEPVCNLGVAYDGTYVTNINDFLVKNECAVSRVSDRKNVDLALIQLKNQVTPSKSHVFSVDEDTDNIIKEKIVEFLWKKPRKKKLEIDQQLYMIGYNEGPVLANTTQGIKVQMTSGKVTQLPDGERILYSIPTAEGSSGSPVLDEQGHLVAVNFAQLATNNNFNFGIPLNKVKSFLNGY